MKPEKLIVKNFGPIKSAEIDLGRVTVFIGEQASGKSILAKLVAIAKDRRLLSDCLLEQYMERNGPARNLFEDYQIYNFFTSETCIEYHFDGHIIGRSLSVFGAFQVEASSYLEK